MPDEPGIGDRSATETVLAALVEEHADLELRLADPDLHADPVAARRAGQRYAEVGAVVRTHQELARVEEDIRARVQQR